MLPITSQRLRRLSLYVALLACFTTSPHALAVWVQGEASIAIKDADVADVRIMAIKSAVADASYKNGSFVVAEDIMLDGLLVSSKSHIRTQGRIQRVEILDENIDEDNVLSVTVRVDITPLFDCAKDDYARSILVTQFQLQRPSQASYGGIFDFGRQISKRFENQLRTQTQAPNVLLIDKAFSSASAYDDINLQDATDKALYLANQYGRQFILFGFVRDISLFEQVQEALLSDDVTLRRNFTVEVYVLDAYRHTMVYQESYHSEGDWEFDDDYTVDTNNSLFWRSDYGRVVLNTIHGAVQDVTNAVTCEKGFAQVINRNGDQVTISMGSRDGIRPGDTFEVFKKQVVQAGFGNTAPLLQAAADDNLTVVRVNDQTATLAPANNTHTTSADLFDLVSPIGLFSSDKPSP